MDVVELAENEKIDRIQDEIPNEVFYVPCNSTKIGRSDSFAQFASKPSQFVMNIPKSNLQILKSNKSLELSFKVELIFDNCSSESKPDSIRVPMEELEVDEILETANESLLWVIQNYSFF